MGERAAVAAVLALIAAAAAAAPASGRAHVVAEPPAGSPAEAYASAPAVALHPSTGGYLAAWVGPVAGAESEREVHTRLLDPSGVPVSAPRRVTLFGRKGEARHTIGSTVLAGGGGRYLLVYTGVVDPEAKRPTTAVYVRALDSDGRQSGRARRISRPVSSEFELGEPAAAYEPAARRFLVTWAPPGRGVEARLVSRDGTPVGDVLRLAGNRPVPSDPAVAANTTSGRFLVAWGGGRDLLGRSVSAARGGVSRRFEVAIGPVPDGFERSDVEEPVLAFDSGRRRFGIAWSVDDLEATGLLVGRLTGDGRRAIGRILAAEGPYDGDGEHLHLDPSIAYSPVDKTFTVAWENFEMSTSAPLCSQQFILERRMRSGGGLVGRDRRELSEDGDPSGPGSFTAGGDNCKPFPNDVVLAPRQDEPGFLALWSRFPYVLGRLR